MPKILWLANLIVCIFSRVIYSKLALLIYIAINIIFGALDTIHSAVIDHVKVVSVFGIQHHYKNHRSCRSVVKNYSFTN